LTRKAPYKCQGAAAKAWLAEREAELLPVPYYHLVFTLPATIADIAWQNKAVVYDLLFRAASETLLTIAADPRHLGARIGLTAVLHTWGSALTHHPHLHIIVPGGGLSSDGLRWIACRPGFFLPVRVLSKLFRRLMLERLVAAHAAGLLKFFGAHAPLADCRAFSAFLAPLKKTKWFVYSKRPFAGPQAVLTYLSRYTHRVAIANSRLIALDDAGVSFRWKDYRADGRARLKTMTLETDEFIRRFLIHVLPAGFTASATTASLPTASAASPSPGRVSCSRRQPLRPQRRKAPSSTAAPKHATRRRHRRSAVPAAAAG
jgi:Putative transposase/Transposase zinc-binding domain